MRTLYVSTLVLTQLLITVFASDHLGLRHAILEAALQARTISPELQTRNPTADPYAEDFPNKIYKREAEELHKRELCSLRARDLADEYGISAAPLARRCLRKPGTKHEASAQTSAGGDGGDGGGGGGDQQAAAKEGTAHGADNLQVPFPGVPGMGASLSLAGKAGQGKGQGQENRPERANKGAVPRFKWAGGGRQRKTSASGSKGS